MNQLFVGVGMTRLESGGKGKKRRGKGGRRDSIEEGRRDQVEEEEGGDGMRGGWWGG